MEFVNFLKHPDKYKELGAKIPKVCTVSKLEGIELRGVVDFHSMWAHSLVACEAVDTHTNTRVGIDCAQRPSLSLLPLSMSKTFASRDFIGANFGIVLT